MTARVEFYRDTAGTWRWRTRVNGRTTADSGEGYASKSNARRAWLRLADLIHRDQIEEAPDGR